MYLSPTASATTEGGEGEAKPAASPKDGDSEGQTNPTACASKKAQAKGKGKAKGKKDYLAALDQRIAALEQMYIADQPLSPLEDQVYLVEFKRLKRHRENLSKQAE